MPKQKTHRVTVLDDYPPIMSDSVAIERLREEPNLDLRIYDTVPRGQMLLERIRGAHTAVVMHPSTLIKSDVVEASPKLRHIAVRGGSTDNIALRTATRLGVTVTCSPGGYAESVAEHALALALSLARRVPELNYRVRAGEWPGGFLNQLSGKIVGIVGYGHAGQRMAELCMGIGMKVLVCPTEDEFIEVKQQGINQVNFETLLLTSDVVSVHVEHSRASSPLFDINAFSSMKSTALFINTSWSRVVDEYHLAEALRNDTIAGAALDVFTEHPIARRHPLLELPNAILSPEVGANTVEAISKGLNTLVDNVLGFFDGRVQNRVQP